MVLNLQGGIVVKAKKAISLLLAILLASLCGCVDILDVSQGTGDTTTTVTSPIEESSAPLIVDAARMQEIEDFLNKGENNGFVGSLNLYDTPEQASLYAIFYDGAGVGEWGASPWDAAEQAAVLSAGGWDEFYVPVLKIEAADVERVLQAKLGVSYVQMETTMEDGGFDYVPAYDAYYSMHSDTNYLTLKVNAVTVNSKGYYVVEYTQPQFDADAYLVVTLRADKGAGYQFVSNIELTKEN